MAEYPAVQRADLVLKTGTATVAALYVFGLMISNAQLMELGIADFASLQARNVTVGMLFVIYLIVLAALLAPLALLVLLPFHPPRIASGWRGLLFALLLIGLEIILLLFSGGFVGQLLPWGRSWGSYLLMLPDWRPAAEQLGGAYWRPKTVVVAAGILAAEILFLVLRTRGAPPAAVQQEAVQPAVVQLSQRTVIGATLVGIILMLTFALFDYADEVYPNFRFNLGGGQPQIANLVLSGKMSETAGLDSAGLLLLPIRSEPSGNSANEIPEVAIWYQSDKFLYLASATHQTKSRVVAVDLKLVRSIHYLPAHTRISSGARIERLDWNAR